MFFASLSILISKRMLTILHFCTMQLTSVIFLFSRLKKYFVLSFYLKQELLIKANPKNLRLGTSRSNMAIVLSDMLSDSIKYQDLWSATHTLIAIFLIRNSYLLIKIGSKRIDKSLYSIPADCKSAGTLALLIHIGCTGRKEATRLLFCRICYPTALSIRIFDPQLIPINQNWK